jgi:hypothetical protein
MLLSSHSKKLNWLSAKYGKQKKMKKFKENLEGQNMEVTNHPLIKSSG